MKTVYLDEIKSLKETEVLTLLKSKGVCMYGDIIKKLGISQTEGQQIIFSLLSRGLIRYQYRSSYLELNIELK